ncbi:ATP-binding cassette domain-containing protein [Streptomyces kanamyceticus]|uniref:ATP-binding cassette domain-containing protein n=1 Tax=Streptomyces kanamyceticus TaxID=1967 RepID=A0A5J6GN94_STRKN|nr:ATP-binding cassette domain-containing protein [Streptomyces kanamyceticus]QEU95591.1 ATP-binding cassette domain-containing protein [Streptomyces kanamyceticus]
MEATIEVRELRKRFGSVAALDGLSFDVTPGQVTGFVGPNGAGKSTTLRILLGLDTADEGTALIGGRRYQALRTPLLEVGALLDAAAVHPSRRGRDHLLWLAHSHGLPVRRVDEVLDVVGLGGAARRRAGGYSLGMRQRLGIAAALLGDPPVLLLDEPVNGLDPEGIRWIRGFLRTLAAEGRTVLVSSHLMGELEDTADHLVVIGRGRVIADTGVAELLAAASGDRVAVRTADRARAMAVLSGAGASVAATGRDTLTVSLLPAERVVALLGSAGVVFSGVAAHRATLEEAYMELTRDAVQFAADETAVGPERAAGAAGDEDADDGGDDAAVAEGVR